MNWHRLDRDKTIGMINSVKSASESLLFSPVTSEAKVMRLPFYSNFLLYRLTNFASLPTFSMDFLGDGDRFFYLDGSSLPVHAVNEIAGLELSTETVVPYLNFYFLNVRLPEGEIAILHNPEEAQTFDIYDEDRRENILVTPENVRIEKDEDTGDMKVLAPVFYDGTLMEALITVGENGSVMVEPQKMLPTDNLQ